jgi:hypothetical protein
MVMNKLVIALLSILLLAPLYFGYQKLSKSSKFKSDENYVRNVMLQKDSEGRGYSDRVKEKIEREFDDRAVQYSVKKFAKINRSVVLSNNEEEFIAAETESMLAQNCTYFITFKKNVDFSKRDKIIEDTIYDNKEMKSYYEYLSLFRFRNAGRVINDILNSRSVKVKDIEEYNLKCVGADEPEMRLSVPPPLTHPSTRAWGE